MPGSVLKAMWGDKYAERARELSDCMCDGVREPCVRCKKLARALEQAALEARIDELQDVRGYPHKAARIQDRLIELRARLAELEKYGTKKI